jgi:hypothetical protein
MMDDGHLQELLRLTFPPMADATPSRDLWPSVANRVRAPLRVSWLDITLAALIAILLFVVPEWLWLLVFHL